MNEAELVPVEMPADPRRVWSSLSQAERDAAYDNTNAVKNSAELIAARNETSARIRPRINAHLDVPYGASEREKIDLYPGTDKTAPCLIFIHGGYWQRNSREVFANMVEGVAPLGWSVAIPGYTLAPEASLTRIVAEIGRSLDWLAKHGADYGVDGPIIVSGWSAGGHLTAMALSHPAVAAGLAISGVYDLKPIRDTNLDAALSITDEEIATLSPLRLPVVDKPMAIAYGTQEVPALIWDSRRFHAIRAAAHAPGPLVPIPGADHFTILNALSRPGGALVKLAQSLPQDHRP